ncbi:MAG: hypothetical protein F6K35_25240, partial [Okeania sp. SIO2H7]|nr:hypothetical protein [Okeania sp. SIO2H7]
MLKNLKLKERLLIGYGIPVALFLGVAGLTYFTANKVFGTFQEVERVQNAIIGINEATVSGEKMIRSFRGYVAVQKEVFVDEYIAASEQFDEAIEILEELIIGEEQDDRLDKMKDVKNNFDLFAKNV